MGGKYHKFRVHSHGMSGHGQLTGPVRRPPFGVNGMRLGDVIRSSGEVLRYPWSGLDSRAEVQLEENDCAAAETEAILNVCQR